MKKPISVGILGLGRAGRFMHAPELGNYPELFILAAGCDCAPDRRENLPGEFQKARIYPSIGELLADDGVELVTVATRNADHTPHAIQALEAGKYVVIEKPIAVNEAQTKELEAAARKHPGKLFCRHNRRFEPAFNHVLEMMHSGLLGNISSVRVRRSPGFSRRFDWQTLTECSGGMLNNWGPHLIDQCLRFLESPVKDLWCELDHVVSAGDAEDQVFLVLRGENGRIVTMDIPCAVSTETLYEVTGSRGSLTVPVEEDAIHLKYLNPEQTLPALSASSGNPPFVYGNPETLDFREETIPIAPRCGYTALHNMWRSVYETIRENKPYPVRLEEALEVVRVTGLARERSGYVPGFL